MKLSAFDDKSHVMIVKPNSLVVAEHGREKGM